MFRIRGGVFSQDFLMNRNIKIEIGNEYRNAFTVSIKVLLIILQVNNTRLGVYLLHKAGQH